MGTHNVKKACEIKSFFQKGFLKFSYTYLVFLKFSYTCLRVRDITTSNLENVFAVFRLYLKGRVNKQIHNTSNNMTSDGWMLQRKWEKPGAVQRQGDRSIHWCTSKNSTTVSLVGEPSIIVFANFFGINNPTMADFKWLTWLGVGKRCPQYKPAPDFEECL